MLFALTEVSGNRKTGKIAVGKSSSDTCPSSCGLWFECYGKFHYLKKHWSNLDNGIGNAVSWQKYLSEVRKKASGIWRHGEVGDLPGKRNKIDRTMLRGLVSANRNKQGFAYTHKPMLAGNYRVSGKNGQVNKGKISEALAKNNREAVKEANKEGFVINLSCDTLADVDRKVALKIAPVVTVLPIDAEDGVRYSTPEGIKITTCPATLKKLVDKEITCKTCKLCAIPERKSVIGFPAHGVAKRRASMRVLNNA